MLGGSKTRSCVLNIWPTTLPQAFHDSDPSWHGHSRPAHNKITSLAQHLVQPKKICHSASHLLSCDLRTARSDFSRIALIQDTCFRVYHARCPVDPPPVIYDHKCTCMCAHPKRETMCCAKAVKICQQIVCEMLQIRPSCGAGFLQDRTPPIQYRFTHETDSLQVM